MMARMLWVAGLMLVMGCDLPAGESWRSLNMSLDVVFDPEARMQDNGRIKTSKNYEIAFNEWGVAGLGLSVEVVTDSAGAEVFDPINPPPGYSLCHNGHCHHDSGELVDYEDIQLELNQQSGGNTSALNQPFHGAVSYDSFTERQSVSVALEACDDLYGVCDIDAAGTILSVSLSVVRVSVDLTVFHPTKLPEEGVVMTLEIPVNQMLAAPSDQDLGRSANSVSVTWELGASIWDRVEFADVVDDAAAGTWNEEALGLSVMNALNEKSTLTVILAE
ncbi:MAG: hypothetical protein VX834_08280 [Myxococcota bacterium]|nr:hypothetical protein [Myxococcota bacterium]